MKENHKLDDLESFFREVARLTLDHSVIDEVACITADILGQALEKVDPEWWKNP